MAAVGKIIGGQYVEFANDGRKGISDSGGSSVFDYEQAINKPSINGVTLQGNKTFNDIGLTQASIDIDFSTYFS